MYDIIAEHIVENFGLDGYFRFKSIIIFLTGLLSASFINTLGFAKTFRKVHPNPRLKKVTLLEVNTGNHKEYYCSPPTSHMEAVQTLFYMWFAKMGFLKKGIMIRNNRRAKNVLISILGTSFVLLLFGIYLSLNLIFQIDEDTIRLDIDTDTDYLIVDKDDK